MKDSPSCSATSRKKGQWKHLLILSSPSPGHRVPSRTQQNRPAASPWLMPSNSSAVGAGHSPSRPALLPPSSRPQSMYCQQFLLSISQAFPVALQTAWRGQTATARMHVVIVIRVAIREELTRFPGHIRMSTSSPNVSPGARVAAGATAHRLSSRIMFPELSCILATRGICPGRAWVAQARQGS